LPIGGAVVTLISYGFIILILQYFMAFWIYRSFPTKGKSGYDNWYPQVMMGNFPNTVGYLRRPLSPILAIPNTNAVQSAELV
jgi:hypothetical protein